MTVDASLPFHAQVANRPADLKNWPTPSVNYFEQIRRAALLSGVAPSLICAVCEQESAWNPWAIRFEPAFWLKYAAPHGVSVTELNARATSWGLMQVLGQTAREMGFADPYLSALCDPATGLFWGSRVLARKLANAGGNVESALLLYNGGGNQNYPAEVTARMGKYA
jgi:soluble lytic murein transglycosylase-like protein